MTSLQRICREVVEGNSDITSCWLIDMDDQRVLASYEPRVKPELSSALVQASLVWIGQEVGMPNAQGVTEASISAGEHCFYFKASENPQCAVVLATRFRVSPGIGWAMTRNFAARVFDQLKTSQAED